MYSIIVAVFMMETRRLTWDKLVLATMPQLSVMMGPSTSRKGIQCQDVEGFT
jgi:hypothetical protein